MKVYEQLEMANRRCLQLEKIKADQTEQIESLKKEMNKNRRNAQRCLLTVII